MRSLEDDRVALERSALPPPCRFRLVDFVAALKFRNGELHLDTDYVRGRRMKTA